MELLDRYLEAVRKYLPWERQDDVIAELRANLEAQIEDKQEELGRALNQDEARAWAGQLPRPALMAGRYRRQQYLIGPELFPIYSLALRTVMFCLATLLVGVNILRAMVHPSPSESLGAAMVAGIAHIVGVLLVYAALLTLGFAVIEYLLLHHPGKFPRLAGRMRNWDPASQPLQTKQARTLPRAVADLVGHLVLLGWLLLLPRYPFLLLGGGASSLDSLPYTLAPAIADFYWALVAVTVVQVVWKAINLRTGAWKGERKAQQAVHLVLVMVAFVILLRAPGHLWVMLKYPAADLARYGSQLGKINDAIYLGARVLLAMTVIVLVADLAKNWFDRYKRRPMNAR